MGKKLSIYLSLAMVILFYSNAHALVIYSNDFEDGSPYGAYFAQGISGDLSGGVDETVIFPGQDPSEIFSGPVVDTSTVFENDADGANFMDNYFYLGGGTKNNVQPASSGQGPRDPVVLTLYGVSAYENLLLEFDIEYIASWDRDDDLSIVVMPTGETIFEEVSRNLARSLSIEFDQSMDVLEIQWVSENTGRDEFFGIDNIKVSTRESVPTPEPATIFLFCSGLVGLAAFRRKLK